MTGIDPRTDRALDQLRREWSPPSSSTEAMLAAFHQRLGGDGGGGGDDGGGLESGGGESIGLVEPVALARLGYAAKVVAATLGMTTAGLASVWLVGAVIPGPRERPPSAEPSAVIVRDASEPARVEPREPTSTIVIHPAPHDEPTSRRANRSLEPSEPTIDLAAELALIRAAEAASPSEAIERLAEHAERFPSGTLTSEREGLWILALCELGRTHEAATRASRFFVEYPSSQLIERIERACPPLAPSSQP